MKYMIEKGVPMHQGKYHELMNALSKMEINDSIVMTKHEALAATKFMARQGWEHATRAEAVNGSEVKTHRRVWRLS